MKTERKFPPLTRRRPRLPKVAPQTTPRARDPDAILTPEEEIVARELAKSAKNRDALAAAFGKQEISSETAAAILGNPAVQNRARAIRDAAARRVALDYEITLESITSMLIEDREFARQHKQAAAAISATMGIAKLHGLWVAERENKRDPLDDYSADELERVLAQIDQHLDAHASTTKATPDGRLVRVQALDVEDAEPAAPPPTDDELFG